MPASQGQDTFMWELLRLETELQMQLSVWQGATFQMYA